MFSPPVRVKDDARTNHRNRHTHTQLLEFKYLLWFTDVKQYFIWVIKHSSRPSLYIVSLCIILSSNRTHETQRCGFSEGASLPLMCIYAVSFQPKLIEISLSFIFHPGIYDGVSVSCLLVFPYLGLFFT